jgi:hypothetical protein
VASETPTLKLAEFPLAALLLVGWTVMEYTVNGTMLLVTLPEGLVIIT